MAIRPIDMQVVVSHSSDANALRQNVLSKQDNALLNIQQQADVERHHKATDVVDRSKIEEVEIQRRMKEERGQGEKQKKKREKKEEKKRSEQSVGVLQNGVGGHVDIRI